MLVRLALLLKILHNPLQALAAIRDRAPYFAGGLMALFATFIYYDALSGELRVLLSPLISGSPGPNLTVLFIYLFQLAGKSAAPLFFLAVVFVPACLFAINLIERRSSFSLLLRQQYAPLLSCVLYAWAAAHLMMLVPAFLIFDPYGPGVEIIGTALKLVPLPYFIFLVTISLRVVMQTTYGRAIGGVAIAAFSLLALPLLPSLLFLLSSPFLLILLFFLLRGFFSQVIGAQRAREEFKQNLEAATLNPADASAHYNLGLIYQQRGQYEEAKSSFRRAIEIDPDETDAHYQLGRIAREEDRLADAIAHFDSVVQRDSEHSQNEIWREIGRVYFQAEQYEDARASFERFLEKRPSDAEGRYRYGLTLHRLGRSDDAVEEMHACIEAVRTAPAYKYRTEKQWMQEAQSFLRSQMAGSQ
ncbi:MAG: tetratricopeptide repeat protein [Blastocatellia bacterium]|nr:tetratricopeptide repeat protein [Blastocatellia bacterium]